MAISLVLKKGAVEVVTLTASDARAEEIINHFLDRTNYDVATMSDQEKADAFMEQIRRYVVAVHRDYVGTEARDAALATTPDWNES